MASEKIEKILEEIGALTLLEAADLAKAFEEKFGVSAAAPIMMAGAGPAAAVEEVEEKTAFDVVLVAAGEQKIKVVKVVRELTSLGLKEAKDLVDTAPKPVKEAVSKEEAASMKAKLEEVGATIEIK